MFTDSAGFLVIFAAIAVGRALELPNTSGIDGQLTANLGVDHFFSLWLVFSNDDVRMSGNWQIRRKYTTGYYCTS